ncbi:hypothetical protein H5410_030283 [Solanum commersonii]|uniref:Uncharacterized protein n=1 Tax=Solanum commersonii TaxID=4109 RepID=A0A9J5YF77_SOLCO|nr:hypothetical protein H5410_030283 [Solanum commersonii]
MFDPIDPLLQADLICYRDMLQACHNAYDLDRSCKIDLSFFYKITLAHDLDHNFIIDLNFFSKITSGENHGYDVSSYIYSKCLTHSIWTGDWSHQANWIGYVLISNDEYSTHLGCHHITIIWHKTMKHVEDIMDIMDFQRPTRDYNMSSHDPSIKIEAGLLIIYTRKHDQCNMCKVSTREQVLNKVKRLID